MRMQRTTWVIEKIFETHTVCIDEVTLGWLSRTESYKDLHVCLREAATTFVADGLIAKTVLF